MSTPWLTAPTSARGELHLFVLPYAGGSATSFRRWGAALPDFVDFRPVHLPGRERRIFEPPIDAMAPMIAAMAPALAATIDRPYVLFGHSMGSIMAWELAAALIGLGLAAPAALIVSGHGGPTIPRTFHRISHLPEDAFLHAVAGLGGLPPEIREHRELLDLILPVLRADFRLCENYKWRPRPPLPVMVAAFGGSDDPIAGTEELNSWRDVATGGLSIYRFEGDHFFLESARVPVLACLNQILLTLDRDPARNMEMHPA